MDLDRIIWWSDRIALALVFLGVAALVMWPWDKIETKPPVRYNIVKCVPNAAGTSYNCSIVGTATADELGSFAP